MPNVNVSLKDMQKLIGRKLSLAEFSEAVLYAKGEVDAVSGDEITVDVKDTNRPDLWSAEGIARELRARLGIEKGIPKYRVKKGRLSCTIEKSVEKTRPFIACALVKNVKVTEDFLIQMIQLQEKVGMTFGRRRKETGIGLYDFGKMKGPVFYRGCRDNEIEFVPLEYKVKMRPSEILKEHPKGKEFGHLLEGCERFPIVIDSKGIVASMPPIINSQETGKVTEKTREIFLEVTGFNWETVNTALNVMVMALADRGGQIESVKINFPKTKTYPKKPVHTPHFENKKIEVGLDEIREVSGLDLSSREIAKLLEKARYKATVKGRKVVAEYPAYRMDILHPVDVIEDVIISYGFEKVKPEPIKIAVMGQERPEAKKAELIRNVCVGLGLQGILTYTMSNKGKQAAMIGLDLEKEQFVELANPVSENYTVFRKQLFPELLEFLAANKHFAYPQKIYEVGKTVELDSKSETGVNEKNKVCIALCGKGAEFTVIKGVLDAIADNLGGKYSLKQCPMPALEQGKSASLSMDGKAGFFGEIEKSVLENFGLKQPTAILELEI
ncbi:MAG: phenylalanine--tRNA ligase subunit beta [Candidatus Diapherotrites archaeon]|uniref:phenylalanine--tRNA ligase n=1 Tax=Candidatus Iainarchaeum sp. TaxID=3101447 RepID=A0A939C982_9ARCH|nr:phenylalanine--tRNA ligase subunit beta [Candidatus Diapherotrites archaeon]